ncbi:Membrane-bound transcription factor site-1 protease [Aphelenchoides bicaudatus]|nr:Membrane-bound transcription factor site-1 protease [Aphelenchoides bicaudatus]
MKFEDSNSKEQTCYPDTGGSNLPALNDLVGRFGFAFGDQVLDGKANLFNTEIRIASGAQLRASSTSAWISTANLNNIVTETMNKTKDLVENAAIFGLDWPTEKSGLVAVFGDSNCFETNECGAILIELLNMENTNDYWRFGLKKSNLNQLPLNDLPNRMTKSNFAKISRVASKVYKTHITSKIIPDCFPKELIENVNLDVKISFDHTDELEQLRTIAREYFKKPNSNQSDILKDSSNSILDYADYDPEMQAKNVVQYYTYRLFHFISVIALISFICFTLQNKLRAFLFKPLIRLLSAFV